MNSLPKHVAIIMDGNGRWAENQGKERIKGHYEGVETVRRCLEVAVEKRLEYLSLFAFSIENWSRPQKEVEGLMSLMIRNLISEEGTFQKHGIRVRVLGDRTNLGRDLLETIDKVTSTTQNNKGVNLTIFLSYSGRWDILQATKNICRDALSGKLNPEDINESIYDMYLVTRELPEPDLIIRTSGEYRISNFLLWQASYSEFYITPTLWPNFSKEDFIFALENFQQRDRRFGRVKNINE